MRLTRERYVTACQQLLVTAAVLALGLSSAGVLTLQIVAPQRDAAAAHADPGLGDPLGAVVGAGSGAGLGVLSAR